MAQLRLFLSHKLSFMGRILGIGGIALLLALGSLLVGVHPAHASGGGALTYVHTSTSANISGATTLLDNTVSNNNPNALVFVTASWNFGGSVLDNHPIGVWYDSYVCKWGIFNEDQVAMPVGSTFNVYVLPGQTATAFQLTATTANTYGNSTYLNNPTLGSNIYAQFLITQDWSPNGVYNPHNVAIRNDSTRVEWGIYNPDGAAIPLGSTYNMLNITGVGNAIFQVATSSNTSGDITCINNAVTNNNPSALVFASYNLDYTATYTDTSQVWYNTSSREWCIFDASFNTLPPGAVFFVLL